MTEPEFRQKLVAAKERRHLTVDEMSRLTNTSSVIMERWLNGISAPRSNAVRENAIRAVE